MAPDLTLIGLGWLLAAASAVLWLRQYPGQRIGHGFPKTRRGRPLDLLGLAGIPLGAYGGTGLQVRNDWGWWVVPTVLVPLVLIGTAMPILLRSWQFRRSTPSTGPSDLDTARQ